MRPRFPARGLLVLFLAGCSSPGRGDDRVAADREDVKHALYVQLDEVLARRRAIDGDPGDAAAREREDLDRLAGDIAVRIVRLDPDANVDALVKRLEQTR